jgi:hypothetical protein
MTGVLEEASTSVLVNRNKQLHTELQDQMVVACLN